MKSHNNVLFLFAFYLFFGMIRSAAAIEYFGYYATSASGSGNHFSEVADHTNTVWILQSSDLATVNELAIASQMGKNAVVDLSYVFFNGSHRLNPDWQSRWNNFVAAAAPYAGSIIAVAPHDEPNLFNIPLGEIETAVSAIHSTYPGKAAVVIFGVTVPIPTAILQLYDWVGFDCYSNGQLKCDSASYSFKYGYTKSQLRPDQRLIIIPQVGKPVSSGGCCISALISENETLFQLAYSDPQVIGIFPFIWQTFNDGSANWLGLSGLPQLQPKVKSIGQAVISHWSYPQGIVPVYRSKIDRLNTYYSFTRNATEILDGGMAKFEGIAFNLFTSNVAGTRPVYGCKHTDYISVSLRSCGASPRILGFIYNNPAANTVALYNFVDPVGYGELVTTKYEEGNRLSYLGILGYVPVVPLP